MIMSLQWLSREIFCAVSDLVIHQCNIWIEFLTILCSKLRLCSSVKI